MVEDLEMSDDWFVSIVDPCRAKMFDKLVGEVLVNVIGFLRPGVTVLVLKNLHLSNRKESKKKSPLIKMI